MTTFVPFPDRTICEPKTHAVTERLLSAKTEHLAPAGKQRVPTMVIYTRETPHSHFWIFAFVGTTLNSP